MTTVGAPTPRVEPTTVWTGREMLVWGGTEWVGERSREVTDGGRYDPLTDRWQRMTTVGAPSPRNQHSAIWTGDELIIWGGWGHDPSSTDLRNFGAGARYNPTTDTWRPISSEGAPSPRESHGAVWTGTEMIVFGGEPAYSTYAQDGARYDPHTDRWTPLPPNPFGSGWYQPHLVWTGAEVLVWGQSNPLDRAGAAARWNPQRDEWAPLSLEGAPNARAGASVFWTGSRLLVWGGNAGRDGGLYDPVADQWELLRRMESPLLAPEQREHETVVWTGRELLVWSGITRGSRGAYLLHTDGAALDPQSGTWRPLSRSPIEPRYFGSGVWTGAEMVVFGGRTLRFPPQRPGGAAATNDGARYLPPC
jgi:hypothetical protein